jgi:DNA recombination protein RmuC
MHIVSILTAALAGTALTAIIAFFMSRIGEKAAFDRGAGQSANQLGVLQEKLSTLAAQIQDLTARLASAEALSEQEREKSCELTARAAALEISANRVPQFEKELYASRQEVSQKQSDIARLETIIDKERRQTEEKLALLNEAKEQMKSDFQNLANRILEEKSAKFTEQNKLNIDTIMSPLRDQLSEFKKRVEDVYDKESKDRVSLFMEITNLKQLNQKISEDAVNLTNALKGDNKTQGTWGELALERVLEMSGLQKGREYEVQVHTHDANGSGYKPDVVIYLPENKQVIVDAKVSLLAYEQYCSADTEEERRAKLKDHVAAVRNQVRLLSSKNYDQLLEVRSLDYVLLFINVEAAFLAAIKEDKELFSDAFAKNIILVCPSTLLVTLRTIANIWRYEYQNQNAQTIAKKAADLYDKFVTFVATLEDVNAAIRKASAECDSAIKLLSTGKGNLVKKVEDFKQLGVKGKKNLPIQLIDASDGDEEDAGQAGALC